MSSQVETKPGSSALEAGGFVGTAGAAPEQHLSFIAAGEEYAVSLLEVKEIVQYSPVTRMPAVAAFIHGVTNLRGKVVPVVDLAVRFGLRPSQVGKRSCIVMLDVILDGSPAILGLLADAVSQILELRPGEIEPPPTFGTVAGAGFLRGMARAEKKFVLVLDVRQLLTGEELTLPSLIADAVAEEDESARKRSRKGKRARKREEPAASPGEPPAEASTEGEEDGAKVEAPAPAPDQPSPLPESSSS